MKGSISDQTREFFESQLGLDIELAFMRNDGIMLYHNIKDSQRSSVVGALVGGIWQASRSLANFVSDQNFFNFRLAFDTSSDGVVILPIQINQKEYLLFGMYSNVYNPGVIKQKLKVLRMNLEKFIQEGPVEESPAPGRQEYLFNNITDEEMDSLFNFGN